MPMHGASKGMWPYQAPCKKGRSDTRVGTGVDVGCTVVVVAVEAAEEARAECLSVRGT